MSDFKVGDKVRFIREKPYTQRSHVINNGDIGEVTKLDVYVHCRFPNFPDASMLPTEIEKGFVLPGTLTQSDVVDHYCEAIKRRDLLTAQVAEQETKIKELGALVLELVARGAK